MVVGILKREKKTPLQKKKTEINIKMHIFVTHREVQTKNHNIGTENGDDQNSGGQPAARRK